MKTPKKGKTYSSADLAERAIQRRAVEAVIWGMPVVNYDSDATGDAQQLRLCRTKALGVGQIYLIGIRDKNGEAFDGGKNYRLNVPPNAPVEQYWSVTAYDRQTHALVKNMARASRSSQIPELQKNTDSPIDLYVGPKAPARKESNWIPTDPKRGFEAMFRAYAPTKALFEKKWVLPDIEKVSKGLRFKR